MRYVGVSSNSRQITTIHKVSSLGQGPHCIGKTRKMATKNPRQEKRREFGNFVCSSCIGFCGIYSGNFLFLVEAGYVWQVSFVFVIVTNHVNWHRENLRSDRENREFKSEI